MPRHLQKKKYRQFPHVYFLSWNNSATKNNILNLSDINIWMKYRLSFLFALLRQTIIPTTTAERATETPSIIQAIFVGSFLLMEPPDVGSRLLVRSCLVTEGNKHFDNAKSCNSYTHHWKSSFNVYVAPGVAYLRDGSSPLKGVTSFFRIWKPGKLHGVWQWTLGCWRMVKKVIRRS